MHLWLQGCSSGKDRKGLDLAENVYLLFYVILTGPTMLAVLEFIRSAVSYAHQISVLTTHIGCVEYGMRFRLTESKVLLTKLIIPWDALE